MAEKKNFTTTRMNTTLVISDTILTVVQDAARISLVPDFKEAAELVLRIIDIIHGIVGKIGAFNLLAIDACGLVYATICMHSKKEPFSGEMPYDMGGLLTTLRSIERFAKKRASRSSILHIFVCICGSDDGKIQRYRDNLRQRLNIYGLKSGIGIQEDIARLVAQQEDLPEELCEREARVREAREKSVEKREKEERERIEREKLEREKLESQRLALEKEIRKQVTRDREREIERLGEERRASLEQQRPLEYTEMMSTPSVPPPYSLHQQYFPPYGYRRDDSRSTTIHWDETTTSITNTNSGDTNSNNITGSCNDSSVKVRARIPRHQGRRR